MSITILTDVKTRIAECKGMVFRYRENFYWSGTRYVWQESMNLLKRKSCPGCEKCWGLREDLHELSTGNYSRPPILPSNPKDQGLYTLIYTNVSTDYETGWVDDYDIEFVEYQEPDDEK